MVDDQALMQSVIPELRREFLTSVLNKGKFPFLAIYSFLRGLKGGLPHDVSTLPPSALISPCLPHPWHPAGKGLEWEHCWVLLCSTVSYCWVTAVLGAELGVWHAVKALLGSCRFSG